MIDTTKYTEYRQAMINELDNIARKFNEAFMELEEAGIKVYIGNCRGIASMTVVTDESGEYLDLFNNDY